MSTDSIGATLRSKRATRTSTATATTTVTVSRSPSSSPEGIRKSIRLTVKMPASKLREVTNGADDLDKPRNIFTENVIISGPRNSRSKRKVVEVDSDEDDEPSEEIGDEEDEEDDEMDAEGDSDLDADGEPDIDAEGDIDMDDAPPVSPIAKQAVARPIVTVTPAAATKVRKTESRAVLEDDDDEDDEEGLSELESDNDIGGQDDTMGLETNDDEPEEEDEEDESDEELMGGSRSSTPDLSKMTRRQRGRIELGGDFLQLPMEPQVKKHLTAEEHAMRRAEMARRRKNLSEKRNEEEKMDTINKLLKKQAPKRRGKISAAEAAGESTPGQQEAQEPEKPDPTMIRCVINRSGYRIGVPDEWFGTPAGSIFGSPSNVPTHSGKLVEEI
ncbi:hypothetical protein MferCBS31731_004514 [Microsporum ferrugineum]